ncbi:MAG: AroM family protein [Chloroflexota bacterium]
MMTRRIGALEIGQSPRIDLAGPLQKLLPNDIELIEVGALDGLTAVSLPDASRAKYPLGTRLRDGTAVTVPETFLLPLLQEKLDELEDQGVMATILLCAGSFVELRGKRPLFKPFDIALATLRSLNMNNLAVLTPFKGQIAPIRKRWQAAGFQANVLAVSLDDLDDPEVEMELMESLIEQCGNLPDFLLLDYVGHPAHVREDLQELVNVPILDLGYLAIQAIVAACR